MIGNSSSGIVEAPSFKLPVVNIGDRQKKRVRGFNVIDVGGSQNEISRGIKRALSRGFRQKSRKVRNPYDCFGNGETSLRIKDKLKKLKIDEKLIKKRFFDLKFAL